jgi:hypothetical protein
VNVRRLEARALCPLGEGCSACSDIAFLRFVESAHVHDLEVSIRRWGASAS